MSFCENCVKGVRHEGTPEGKWETLGGVETYVATPTVDYPKNKVILFLTDIFGPSLPNSQLLADDFARNGFKVVIPDILNGDSAPPDALSGNTSFSLQDWFANHTPAHTRPTVDKVVAALKEQGVTDIAAAGYCFGARAAFDLAFDGLVKVVVVSHPSLLQIPDDLEKYLKVSKAPLLINSCTDDPLFPHPSQEKADEVLGGGKFAPGYKREYFEGCAHGFTIRGDLSDPKVVAGREGAFKASVEWLIKYL
ncbi:dienelactone hydrolase endo-1,3,1,4-beta-D-glucanase [Pleurotus eryngii]|uniref:Dienelactone hydrolase endo-1,3,1,4-beta-D-glucanase n=2 Tax=Pleurotus TaxID=5320 RepID=A0A9P6A8G7_PLEER|nr:dienelactone hydrolase endo-1,3,1,4-beta-D-glucanase [Pleurotus eryngii]KAG9223986.1 hypothetical protein CCMSSC00406_0004398 [Pleurotus cornucopiae]